MQTYQSSDFTPGGIGQCLQTLSRLMGWFGWAEAQDAAEHPTMHRMVLRNKEIDNPNVNSAKVKNSAHKCHSTLGISCPTSAYSIFMFNLNLIYRK